LNKRLIVTSSLITIMALLLSIQTAFAHTTVHVGNYDVEVGWVNEPPIVGERNYVVVNVSNTSSTSSEVDISKLTVNVTYGGQSKTLTLQPFSEDTKNRYIAPILPTAPGQYTVQLRGLLDSTTISTDVTPEEVAPAETLAFPSAGASKAGQSASLTIWDWAAILGLVAGLAALVLATLAFRKGQ
jgi:hypothetical protein